MIGPHIQLKSPSTMAVLDCIEWNMGGGCETGREVIIEKKQENRNFLHEIKDISKILLSHDLYVLFNPGFGSKPLTESWLPTLQILLQTKKPILCTAHSAYDLSRDINALQKISLDSDYEEFGEPLEFVISPHLNPFRSHKRTIDSKEETEAQVITTNEYIYAFQAK